MGLFLDQAIKLELPIDKDNEQLPHKRMQNPTAGRVHTVIFLAWHIDAFNQFQMEISNVTTTHVFNVKFMTYIEALSVCRKLSIVNDRVDLCRLIRSRL